MIFHEYVVSTRRKNLLQRVVSHLRWGVPFLGHKESQHEAILGNSAHSLCLHNGLGSHPITNEVLILLPNSQSSWLSSATSVWPSATGVAWFMFFCLSQQTSDSLKPLLHWLSPLLILILKSEAMVSQEIRQYGVSHHFSAVLACKPPPCISALEIY